MGEVEGLMSSSLPGALEVPSFSNLVEGGPGAVPAAGGAFAAVAEPRSALDIIMADRMQIINTILAGSGGKY